MAKSHTSQRNRSDGAKRHATNGDALKGSRARGDDPAGVRLRDRSENLVFYLVTSILLHSVLFLGSDWLRASA
ncbi:MAG: hypothetical protein HC862_12625 [Scytonema sp. RU_4_4]|nr:hypothetical protein [Scytonema sp. RU_4_4]